MGARGGARNETRRDRGLEWAPRRRLSLLEEREERTETQRRGSMAREKGAKLRY